MITLYLLFKLLCRIQIKPARTVTRRTVKTVYTPGNKNVTCAAQRRQFEQERKNAEKARKEQFKRYQAEQDIIHYTQVKRDLLTAYNASGILESDTEKAIRKRIQYDNAIRRAEKQIETAAYNARRTG